jgi:hypothetical protein
MKMKNPGRVAGCSGPRHVRRDRRAAASDKVRQPACLQAVQGHGLQFPEENAPTQKLAVAFEGHSAYIWSTDFCLLSFCYRTLPGAVAEPSSNIATQSVAQSCVAKFNLL